MNSPAMRVLDSRAGVFGMSQRDEVVDEEYRLNTEARQFLVIAWKFHSAVACMQQYAILETCVEYRSQASMRG